MPLPRPYSEPEPVFSRASIARRLAFSSARVAMTERRCVATRGECCQLDIGADRGQTGKINLNIEIQDQFQKCHENSYKVKINIFDQYDHENWFFFLKKLYIYFFLF